MAENRQTVQFNTFVKGLNTEASPLNFPPDTSKDEDNMVLNIDGTRQRRLGLGYEVGNALVDTGESIPAAQANTWGFFRWDNADNKASNSIGVVQLGKKLWFMDMFSTAPSANLLNSGNSITLTSATSSTPQLSFTDINGKLVIVSDSLPQPQLLAYDTDTDIVSAAVFKIDVRDLWGVDDGLADDNRPGSLSAEHEYNLKNQGWPSARVTTFKADGTSPDPNTNPSNSDLVHLGKKQNTDGTFDFDATLIKEAYLGNTPAPKGKFIIDFFDRGTEREAESSVSGLPTDDETGFASVVTTHFSRLFYSGMTSDITDSDDKSPNATALILYTQIIKNDTDFSRCYQEADPTSEEVFDLVASDGGFIAIPEMGNVLAMVPISNQLVVLASNGVWSIVNEGAFTPTSYEIHKVSDIGIVARDSAIAVEGSVVYWSKSGIYVLQIESVSQKPQVQDITQGTIKSFYNNIDATAKVFAKGYYDSINKKAGWLYNDESTYSTLVDPDNTTRELVFDISLQAFYTNTHSQKSSNSPYVVFPVLVQDIVSNDIVNLIEVNGDQVQVDSDDVQVTTEQRVDQASKLKFLTFVPDTTVKFTLSIYNDGDFLDWITENFVSFLWTGQETFADAARTKGVPYLIMHFNRTEDGFTAGLVATNQSSCNVQARWEFTDDAVSNRWGTSFEAYRYRRSYVPVNAADLFETGHELITTKNKLRGRGKAISLYMSSTQGKDMQIIGWAMSVLGATVV